MIFIPGEIIAVITFPGVIIHEISHRFMCDIFKIPVYEVSYFSIGSERAGHVIHAATGSTKKNLLIGIAPLFFNSLVCMAFTFPLSSTSHISGEPINNFFNGVLWWIGMCAGANAFPSNQDVSSTSATEEESIVFELIRLLIIALNFLRKFWIDFIYAYLISLILPYLIFG